jgi:hypothetical protein
MSEDKLSKGAQDLLSIMQTWQPIGVPLRTVQHQWSEKSRIELQELTDAGLVEAILAHPVERPEEKRYYYALKPASKPEQGVERATK